MEKPLFRKGILPRFIEKIRYYYNKIHKLYLIYKIKLY